MPIAIYARCSAGDQDTEVQPVELRAYAERTSAEAIEFLDDGVSGRKDPEARPPDRARPWTTNWKYRHGSADPPWPPRAVFRRFQGFAHEDLCWSPSRELQITASRCSSGAAGVRPYDCRQWAWAAPARREEFVDGASSPYVTPEVDYCRGSPKPRAAMMLF